ncbi:hypothetical protein D5047_20170 [Verminephrobacter eiseniae]|nr:hypothetical protein [Verminephrobacter eiseniae]
MMGEWNYFHSIKCRSTRPPGALCSIISPVQAMKEWHQHPHLFHERPYDRPGCDTDAVPMDSSANARQSTPVIGTDGHSAWRCRPNPE